jgi:Histidine kinase
MSSPLRPLSEGNRLQRRYAAWAQPYYLRMPAEVRESAELLDRFLYSRRGLGVWVGLLCAVAGSSAGLHGAGMPWWLAIFLSALFWFLIPLLVLIAWLVPDRVLGGKPLRWYLVVAGLSAFGAVAGFAVGHAARRGRFDWAELVDAFVRHLGVLTPMVLLVVAGIGLLMWGIAHIRRGMLQQQLERSTLEREAAEARLRLLQGQIQPHFIFNTLSALQHWVDTGDARAGTLLRSLTAFLRASTESLAGESGTLGDEAALVSHYLAIQQARLGPRLRCTVTIAPQASAVPLPAGLLLTLVENAVEHGIAPALDGGEVRVSAALDGAACRITVSNTGALLAAERREGIGLANSRQRLAQRFGARATLSLDADAQATTAVVSVPLP